MAHAQKPDFVFRRKGRVHLNRRGRQYSRLLAADVRSSAVVMLDALCYEVVWRVLATHSIRQFSLHFPSRASPCAITFQRDPTGVLSRVKVAKAWCWPFTRLSMGSVNFYLLSVPTLVCDGAAFTFNSTVPTYYFSPDTWHHCGLYSRK